MRILTAREQVEMLGPWRTAMADTAPWHPLITRSEGSSMGKHHFQPETYDVRIPHPNHPQGGSLVGRLEISHHPHEPEVYVDTLSSHPDRQGQGIAQALIERMVNDHPNHHINPGVTTDEGSGFTQRLMETNPEVKAKIAPGWKLSPMSDEGDAAFNLEQDRSWWDKHAMTHEAMADTSNWHPLIDHKRYVNNRYNMSHGTYSVNIPDFVDPSGKRTIAELDYETEIGRHNGPVFLVNSLGVHPEFQGRGVAQALMERAHHDHPVHRINPGDTTHQGTGFTERLLDMIPGAHGKLDRHWQMNPLTEEESKDYLDYQNETWERRDKPNSAGYR